MLRALSFSSLYDNGGEGGEDSSMSSSSNNPYPYTRFEECSWQPEEVASNLYRAVMDNRTSSSSVPLSPQRVASSRLQSRGWSLKQSLRSRALYGHNSVSSETDSSFDPKSKSSWRCLLQPSPCVYPVLKSFADQIKEPLILMLLFSAVLSLCLGQTADAISIAIALTIVSLVAAVQEYRSGAALDKLKDLVPHSCTVMRDGRVRDRFEATDLVVGDLIFLGTGDRVPADCRLIDAVEVTVDESSLTGENTPVLKTCSALSLVSPSSSSIATAPPLTEQRNITFAGTLICSGRGRAMVLAVGQHTEFGRVASELSEVETRKSPLQLQIDALGKSLAGLSSVAILLIALLGWFLGRPFLETATVAVSLAVAAIPEGLPICVTVTLALGVLKMAKSSAIVKRLPAVEALGSATVVASDKTGTLTQNQMTARSVYTLAYPTLSFGLTGVGYDAGKGELVRSTAESLDAYEEEVGRRGSLGGTRKVTQKSMEFGPIQALFGVASLCNNATFRTDEDDLAVANRDGPSSSSSSFSGQPTELALLVGARKAGVTDPRPFYHRTREIPFTSDRKKMEVRAHPVGGVHCCAAFTLAARKGRTSTYTFRSPNKSFLSSSSTQLSTPTTTNNSGNDSKDGSLYFVKGMPESVLAECSTHTAADGSAVPLTEKGRSRALSQSRRMASSGLRVMAMAYGPTLDNNNNNNDDGNDTPGRSSSGGHLTFAGLIGLEDPPREGVVEAVRSLRQGGVTVLMVTGDSKETALAIAKRCGIVGASRGNVVETEVDAGSWGSNSSSSSSSADVIPVSHNPFDDLEFGAGLSLSGEELDAIPPSSLADSIMGVKVFYRVAPRHKLALVRAFQKRGEIVAMTGDGVNDATALKAADIGVAMGKEGTDVAKEAADVVLADDDFGTIVKAVAEGKGIFFNIRNFLAFQLSTSLAALTIESIATAVGMPSPLNAMQILWINIIMDGPPAQSLGVEPVDERILRAKPRKPTDPIVTRALLFRAVTSAALIVFLTLRVFANELDDGKVTRRDTTVTFATFVNCDLFNAYTCRSSERCFYELDFFGNPTFLWAIGGSVLGQFAVIYFKPLQEVFQTEALSAADLLYILFLSSSVLILDTLRKKFCTDLFSDNTLSLKKGTFKKYDISKADSGSFDSDPGTTIVARISPKTLRNETVRSRIPLQV